MASATVKVVAFATSCIILSIPLNITSSNAALFASTLPVTVPPPANINLPLPSPGVVVTTSG
ncbi:hypothetical protein [Rickettsia australis]|uniref:hypothetical protein n=1 Tax=Rickettsia australis TaxID=787 RepID=UPI0012DF77B8|nr:hypothetical protein [Rickettsia australis]